MEGVGAATGIGTGTEGLRHEHRLIDIEAAFPPFRFPSGEGRDKRSPTPKDGRIILPHKKAVSHRIVIPATQAAASGTPARQRIVYPPSSPEKMRLTRPACHAVSSSPRPGLVG